MPPLPSFEAAAIRRRLTRVYAFYAAGLAALVFLLVVLQQLGLPMVAVGIIFVAFTLALYVAIGIASRTMKVTEYFASGRRVPAVFNGIAMAAGAFSGVAFFALAGTIWALGYDGLAYILGWTAGFVLLAVLVAPALRKSGTFSVPDFLALRFPGRTVRGLAVVVLLCCSMPFLVAVFSLTGLVASRHLGIEFDTAVMLTVTVLLLCILPGGMRAVTWTQVAQYLVLVVAYLVPIGILAVLETGLPLPHLAFSPAAILPPDGAAGAAGIRFEMGDPVNFFALVACLMFGTAALPHVLMRAFAARRVHSARRSAGWGLVFATLILITAPAYAGYAAGHLFGDVVGVSVERLPAWVFDQGRLGLIQLCGVDAVTVEAVRSACGDAAGGLRLADLSFEPDLIVLSLSEIAGLPYIVTALVTAGGLAAALATASSLLLTVANAIAHDVYFKILHPRATGARRLIVARLALVAVAVAGGYWATFEGLDVLALATLACSLAAAGLFPALVLGIWWKRCTAPGAAAGIVAGFALAAFHFIASRYGADLQAGSGDEMPAWFGIAPAASGVFGLPAGFVVAILVSLVTRAPTPDDRDTLDRLRQPRGEIILRDPGA